ncbi:MAG TPA: hypothetical protein VEA37_10625 [Flavobacterium sp.]|nr:hypothetical protein [Flavobacterium sp.]
MFNIFRSKKQDLRKTLSDMNFDPYQFMLPPNRKEVKEFKNLINSHADFFNKGFKETSIEMLIIAKNRIEDYILKLNQDKAECSDSNIHKNFFGTKDHQLIDRKEDYETPGGLD